MLPTLLLAAAITLTPEHRVADLRSGATQSGESVLAIDGDRVITLAGHALRAVPLDDTAQATTLVSGVTSFHPVAAPPLIAWTSGEETHIAPIDAPDRGTRFPRSDVLSMKCNATACLASTGDQLLLLGLDAKLLARVAPGGFVLAADPGGFLVGRFEMPFQLRRIDNGAGVTFTSTAVQTPSFNIAADFDGDRYALVWGQASALRAQSVGLRGDAGEPADIAVLPDAVSSIAVAMPPAGTSSPSPIPMDIPASSPPARPIRPGSTRSASTTRCGHSTRRRSSSTPLRSPTCSRSSRRATAVSSSPGTTLPT